MPEMPHRNFEANRQRAMQGYGIARCAMAFKLARRGPKVELALHRKHVAIGRYLAARRRLAFLAGQTVPNWDDLSDAVEWMLADKEGRRDRIYYNRDWHPGACKSFLASFPKITHPVVTTAWCTQQLRSWPGAKGSTGIDPVSLKPWGATSARPSQTPSEPSGSDP